MRGLDFNKFKANLLNTNHIVEELPELSFLDGLEKQDLQDGVVMSSYPRSGNTLLRSYLEKITGLVTGSDTDISHGLNRALLTAGLQGEGLVDKRVWIIKTHYPERYGGTMFGAERSILLVRNPLDAIVSVFNLFTTKSHTLSVKDDTFIRFSNVWKAYVETELRVWKEFHNFWLQSKLPVHIIRYEDLVSNPESALTELMKFVLNVKTLENTRAQAHIKLATNQSAPEVYKPRKGKAYANREKFGKQQLAELYEEAKELIDMFGYRHYFMDEEDNCKNYPIKNHNKKALSKSIYNQNEAKEIVSIMMNNSKGLVRPKMAGSNAQRYENFLTAMKVGIIDRQGRPLTDEEFIKQMTLTVTLEAPPKENEKEEQLAESIETAVKKAVKRNKTPEQ